MPLYEQRRCCQPEVFQGPEMATQGEPQGPHPPALWSWEGSSANQPASVRRRLHQGDGDDPRRARSYHTQPSKNLHSLIYFLSSSSCSLDIPNPQNVFLSLIRSTLPHVATPMPLYSSSWAQLRNLLCKVSWDFSRQSWWPLVWVPRERPQHSVEVTMWWDKYWWTNVSRLPPQLPTQVLALTICFLYHPLIPTLHPICGLWSEEGLHSLRH